jgi:aryl-alcohol dehydrogenase-like predicted oxidoreductase
MEHTLGGSFALGWLLDPPPNILLIPGARTRAHLTENLGAGDVALDEAARRADAAWRSQRFATSPA